MYQPCRSTSSRGRSSEEVNDTFHQVYVPLLKITMNISLVKYICLLVYCIRSMQEHLSVPTYCTDPNESFRCSSSTCYWLHRIVLNLPRFMISGEFFVEKCAYLLIFFFISCTMFLYAVYLVKHETELKIRYRAILTLPSMFFEMIVSFLSYYSTIISIFNYSSTAQKNPDFFSSAFIIFAFIISIFYALLLVIHFATLYYIMIYPVIPLSIYTVSNANYSTLNYGQRGGSGRSNHYETLNAGPLLSDSYRLSVNNWQAANETRGTVSSYSQIRGWNNTIRSTNTMRQRDDVDNDYLELI
ncbi:uncharacterized protein CELE_Y65B4BL.3 [Caenorhabditis elegans]|uniref:Transmembrane protein n=2 Tax=Caenorhabditis elegans TaxID=6239 RepID=Q9N305_CAEEL|nr:Transmembrane protein [Caenorhabditis elegans]CCD73495.1 Transmembrane protein [Caenorhabditis elegans]|eukprot:NP_490740.3 Uncharacterized protein CELE_Y65B4BL.3 [Caenorhabditis elegans]